VKEEVLKSNPHVRGFELPATGNTVVVWWNKDYTLFPHEVEAALERVDIFYEPVGLGFRKNMLPTMIDGDPMGGAQDYLVGEARVHITCAGKFGLRGRNGAFLPNVTWKDFRYWENFLMIMKHPKHSPIHVFPGECYGFDGNLDRFLSADVGEWDGWRWPLTNIAYGLEGRDVMKIGPNGSISGSGNELDEGRRMFFPLVPETGHNWHRRLCLNWPCFEE
jgi:hypothetical protein